MQKVVQLYLNKTILFCASGVLIASCASNAPPLPTDTTSVGAMQLSAKDFTQSDLVLDCFAIKDEINSINQKMVSADNSIVMNRTQNQVAGYLGSMTIVPLIATNNHENEKSVFAKGYARKDVLSKLAHYKQCSL